METSKLFFHSNIRFLRERRRLSQEDFAALLGLKRTKLTALESGQTRNPTAEDLIRFSEKFRISIDSLMKVDLSKLTELKLRELEAGNDVYMTGSAMRVLAISTDKHNNENVEYVPATTKMGYASGGYADPVFIEKLPKYNLPNLPKNGTYRTFPGEGDSMLPIPDGSDITGKFIQDWKAIKPKTPAIVILKGEQNFVFKLITIHHEEGTILFESLNPVFVPYVLEVSEVVEIWGYYCFTSRKIPEVVQDLQEIKIMIQDLRKDMMSGKK